MSKNPSKNNKKNYFKIWTAKFLQAWTACMMLMVQGNLTAVSADHVVAASKTGAITGLTFVIVAFLLSVNNKWVKIANSAQFNVWVTGALTMIADALSHSGYSDKWIEAIFTGLGTVVLCYLVEHKKLGYLSKIWKNS